MTRRLYLDLDGVMADFDAHFPSTFGLNHRSMADDAMWETINAHPSYFRDMPPCAGAIEFFQEIHHILEARRTELRHGTLAIVRATMTGFTALPSPPTKRAWHDVLEVRPDATLEAIEANYRRLAKDRHPDHGGSTDAMAELNAARAEALKERA